MKYLQQKCIFLISWPGDICWCCNGSYWYLRCWFYSSGTWWGEWCCSLNLFPCFRERDVSLCFIFCTNCFNIWWAFPVWCSMIIIISAVSTPKWFLKTALIKWCLKTALITFCTSRTSLFPVASASSMPIALASETAKRIGFVFCNPYTDVSCLDGSRQLQG